MTGCEDRGEERGETPASLQRSFLQPGQLSQGLTASSLAMPLLLFPIVRNAPSVTLQNTSRMLTLRGYRVYPEPGSQSGVCVYLGWVLLAAQGNQEELTLPVDRPLFKAPVQELVEGWMSYWQD